MIRTESRSQRSPRTLSRSKRKLSQGRGEGTRRGPGWRWRQSCTWSWSSSRTCRSSLRNYESRTWCSWIVWSNNLGLSPCPLKYYSKVSTKTYLNISNIALILVSKCRFYVKLELRLPAVKRYQSLLKNTLQSPIKKIISIFYVPVLYLVKQVLNPRVWSQSLVSSPSGWEKHVSVRAEDIIDDKIFSCCSDVKYFLTRTRWWHYYLICFPCLLIFVCV